jgi:hypothetical protein
MSWLGELIDFLKQDLDIWLGQLLREGLQNATPKPFI